MATTVRRKPAFSPVQAFTEHLSLKADASKIGKRADTLKTRLKDWLKTDPSDVYANENGSRFYDLDATLTIDGVDYSGMELRRSVSTKFDEEVAEKILVKKDVLAEAQSSYIDQDKIYRLHQEGKITDRDLEKMFVESESFAFWPVKGEVD